MLIYDNFLTLVIDFDVFGWIFVQFLGFLEAMPEEILEHIIGQNPSISKSNWL